VPDWLRIVLFAQVGTASTLEIIWSAVGLAGLVITLYLWLQAWLDYRALRRADDYKPHGPRHEIAMDNIQMTAERLSIFVICVLLGGIAMSAKAPRGQPGTASIVFDLVVIMAEVGWTLGALSSARRRVRVFALLYAQSERVERLRLSGQLAARLRDAEREMSGPEPPATGREG
jgi:hypothetical protein